jgi:hypothetical protein
MKRWLPLLLTSAALAGTPASQPAPASPPDALALLDGRLTLDLQERLRFEARENNFDFNSAVNSPQDASWLLQRFRLGLGYSLTPWLKLYAQGQDVREIGGSRPNEIGVFAAEGDDVFDVLKAFAQVGDAQKGASATIGRQFLSYGDQRLVGPLEWLNTARSFDAVKLRWADNAWSLDLFTSSPVTFKDHEWNKSQIFDAQTADDTIFSGAYLSTRWLPFNATTDFYLFHKCDNGNNAFGPSLGDTRFVTLGTLWKGDPKKLGGWDYEAEMAFQKGDVNGRTLTAFAGHWGLGYTWLQHPWKPRLGLQYNWSPGDSDSADRELGTFQNLYPTNHLFYGFMDTTGWVNVRNPQFNFSIQPTAKLRLTLDYHLYWNDDNNDAWRRVNGVTPVRPVNASARSASNFRGQEIDLTAHCKLKTHVALLAGYSVFFAGDYLADTGASDNAHFGYLQLQIDF